jgi:hypothetical protein
MRRAASRIATKYRNPTANRNRNPQKKMTASNSKIRRNAKNTKYSTHRMAEAEGLKILYGDRVRAALNLNRIQQASPLLQIFLFLLLGVSNYC